MWLFLEKNNALVVGEILQCPAQLNKQRGR